MSFTSESRIRSRPRKAHPALRVDADDLDAVAETLRQAGAPVDWDERYPGVRRFYTADPFGNRIEILAG
jgi:catechol 2,3-dioxygenase-like lactoylglutathione lyase family enzyme